MKRLLLILIFCPILSFSQVKVLGDIDFLKKDYKLVFIYQRGNDTAYLVSRTMKNFMISDKHKLIELQNTWTGNNETDKILECGYDYYIYIVDKDSIVGTLRVNIWCGQVIASGIGNSCEFKGNPFKNLTIDKPIYELYLSTDTITKARKLYNQINSTKGVYYPDKKYNDWINYDGQAYISITAKNDTLKRRFKIKKDFDEKYGIVNQYIDFWGFSKGNYTGWIFCSQSFYEKLIETKFEWTDFNVYIRKNSWESWATRKKKFSAFVFSENENLLNDLKNNSL
jgi:hypothetical protein